MADTVKCSQGHENKLGDKFCRSCGDKLSGGLTTCQHCGAMIDSGSNFCGKCGKSTSAVREDEKADIQGMRWQRLKDDFATRVDVEDLPGIFKKGVIIEQGTKALLFINGALAETLQPGRYDLGGISSKIKNFDMYRTGTAILIDSGDVELNLNIAGIYTKDPLNIDVNCKVVAQIENPSFFFNNVMKGRRSYLLSELKGSLYDEMHNALNEAVSKKSVTELNTDLSLKRQFEVSVENHLRTTFQRNGLNFVQLRTVDYAYKGYDKVRGVYEETFLLVSKEDAELQKRKRLFDVYDKTQLQDIFEQTKEVQYREQRNKVWADMRGLINSDKMNEVKSADDLEAYLHEINKGKYLREDEVQELLNTFKQSGLRRDFLLDKIKLEQNIERERIDLVGHEENKLAEWEVKAKRERSELEEKIRSQKDLKAAERDIKVEGAKADATVKDLEREADEKDMDLGLKGLKAVKELKAKEKREEMEIETERLKRLSEMGIEALITASDSDKAEMLKDLKKTEMLKEMTDEQILAMGAKDSPELAKAFQEKFKGLSAEEQKKLYDKMFADKDKMHSDTMKMMQEMFNKSLETQRDVSVAAAQSGKPGVVYPPTGQSGIYTTGGEAVICPKCKNRVVVTPGLKFCNNCGNEVF